MAIAITSPKPSKIGFFSDLLHSVSVWRSRRRAADELRALDDRMLADLGVSRSDIERVVREGVRR